MKGELADESPLEAKPQWVPYFKKQALKDPVNILKHWREFSHASYEYVRYVKDNFAYEVFIMTMVRSAALADWWLERIYKKAALENPPER